MVVFIIVFVAILFGVIPVLIYNRLVDLRQNVRQGWVDIDAQLRQRHDLVPNLVNTVQGYAKHEKATLEAVITARNLALGAADPSAAANAEAGLSGTLKSLFALAESYPDLKANQNFQTLQFELSDIEDKLAASRRAYNAATADYNAACQAFPAVILAGPFGFGEERFWELSSEDRASVSAPPEVQF